MGLEKLGGKMFSEEDLAEISALLRDKDISGWFGNHTGGPYLRQFENAVADACGTKHAVAASSGSASIYIALRALGVGSGDVVAVPAYTHVGSVAPILLAGARPLFIEVGLNGNMDPVGLDFALKTYRDRGRVKAIVAVHQLGMPCDMHHLREVAENIPIVEDASHAMCATYEGVRAGGLGAVGCFSVGGGRTKIVGTGEGGVATTNSDELAEKLRNLRNHGDRVSNVGYLCFNFRMSELNALVGLIQMRRLRELVAWQVRNARYLISNLHDSLLMYPENVGAKTVNYLVGTIFTKNSGMNRDSFLGKVAEKGFAGGVPRMNVSGGYSKLVQDVALYHPWRETLKISDFMVKCSIWVDWHRYPRTIEEIDALLNCFKEILEG